MTTTARGAIPGVLNGAADLVLPGVPTTTQDFDAEVAQLLGELSTLGDTAR